MNTDRFLKIGAMCFPVSPPVLLFGQDVQEVTGAILDEEPSELVIENESSQKKEYITKKMIDDLVLETLDVLRILVDK